MIGRRSRWSRRWRRRGASLLEMTAAVVVMGIAAAVLAPVTAAASDAYASATRADRAVSEATHALDRVCALLRDTPPGDDPGELGIAAASETELRFSDGRGVRLDGRDLLLVSPDGTAARLATHVDVFSVACLGPDGVGLATDPAAAHVYEVALTIEGFAVRTRIFPRARLWSQP